MIFVNSILVFLLCFLTHFLYDWFPNSITALFFPVNESIWEHMKMIYTTFLIYGFIEHLILKKFNIEHENLMLTTTLKGIICVPIYLIIYLPIYHFIGENMAVTFIILFISILLTNYLGHFLLSYQRIYNEKLLSLIIITIIYVLMGVLTFNPPHKEIFFDPKDELYGINDYLTE